MARRCDPGCGTSGRARPGCPPRPGPPTRRGRRPWRSTRSSCCRSRRRRRTRHPEGPQPEQLVLLEFDAASAPVAAAVGASHEPVPDDDADGPSGTVTATAPAAAQDGAPTEAETASADTAAGDTAVVAVQEAGPDPSPAPDLGAAQSEPVDATPIAPWRPVFDHADDLGGVLQARSPLLSRAFGRRGRPPVTSADPDRSSTRSDRGDGHAGHDEG